MIHVRVPSPDGWRAEYDRDETPHRFDVFDAAGVLQSRVSRRSRERTVKCK